MSKLEAALISLVLLEIILMVSATISVILV